MSTMSPASATNADITQKFKAMLDTSLTYTQQVTEGMELVTYLLTPVAYYSVMGLIVGGVTIII